MEQALQRIRRMAAKGRRFEQIEVFIENCTRLNEEERAVLWLIAWMRKQHPVVACELGRPRSDHDHVHDVPSTGPRAEVTCFGS